MKKHQGFAAYALMLCALLAVGIGGWIANIVKLVGMDQVLTTGMGIARIVGIFIAPLGSVLGFL